MTFSPKVPHLAALAAHSFRNYAENNFVSAVGEPALTYAQTQQKVLQVQKLLKALKVQKGDKIALCSENKSNWGITYLAITTLGAVAVPILPDFHNNEIHHIIKHSEAKIIFVSQRMANKLFEEHFKSKLEYVFSVDSFELIEDKTEQHSALYEKGVKTFEQIKAKALQFAKEKHLIEVREEHSPDIKGDDLAVIIYTSGTTGQSKGVMLSHHNLVSQLTQADAYARIQATDRFLSILPLAHTYECSIGFLLPFANGSAIHYINKVPSPKVILAAMQVVKPTCMLSVPLVIEKIYKNKVQNKFHQKRVIGFCYENFAIVRKQLNKLAGKKLMQSFGGELRFFGIGGAKLSEHVEQFLSDANFPYSIGYGLTETAPLIAGAGVGKTKVGSTGVFAPGMDYRFVKKSAMDRDGELHVRGPNVMLGYYKESEITAQVLDEQGWLNTGDLGYVDKDGMLTINGRSKNVIISASGKNIYPESVEAVINQHPLVLDSMVYELDGQLVAKIHIDYDLFDEQHDSSNESDYELHKDILTTLNRIKNSCNQQLAAYSRLKAVFEQTDPFHKTPTKKIKRYLYL